MKIEPIQIKLEEIDPHLVIGRNVILIEQLTRKVKQQAIEIERLNKLVSGDTLQVKEGE